MLTVLLTDTAVRSNDAFFNFYRSWEMFATVVFTLEYGLRLWSCVEGRAGLRYKRLNWAAKPLSVLDLLSLASFYFVSAMRPV